jgi:hypothetical protein
MNGGKFFAELQSSNVWGAHAPSRAGCDAPVATYFLIINATGEEEAKVRDDDGVVVHTRGACASRRQSARGK